MHFRLKLVSIILGVSGSLIPCASFAAPTLAEQVRQLQQQLVKWEQERSKTDALLQGQQQQIKALEKALNTRPASTTAGRPATPQTGAAMTGNIPVATEKPQIAIAASGAAGTAQGNPDAQAKMELVAQSFEVPGVLTPRGGLTVEPSLLFGYSSSNRVALLGYTIIPAISIGLIDIRRVNRNSWTAALTGRYGLSNRLELEGRLPYLYQSEDSIARPLATGSTRDEVFNTKGHGIGDAELGLRYQFNQPPEGNPYFIGSFRVKSNTGKGPFDVDYVTDTDKGIDYLKEQPTGSGFWGYQLGASAILPSDPAVFFGAINYTWNQKYNVDQNRCVKTSSTDSKGPTCKSVFIGEIDPGDVIGISFGAGVALNEKASINLSYEHNVVGKSKVNGTTPTDAYTAQIGMLQIGYSYRLDNKYSLNLSVGVGTTEDSPDVQIALRSPFTLL